MSSSGTHRRTPWRRARMAWSEGLANAFAPGFRQWALVVAIALLMALPALAEWATVSSLKSEEARRIASGEFSYRIAAPAAGERSGSGLSAASCWRLDDLGGVRAAGPIWEDDAYVFASVSELPVAAVQLSPGALRVLAPETFPSGSVPDVAIGASLAALLGVVDQQVIALGQSRYLATVLSESLGSRLGGSWSVVRVPGATAVADCLVAAEPSSADWFTADNLGAVFGTTVTVTPILSVPSIQRPLTRRYAGRLTRWIWLPAAVLGTVILTVVNHGRRRSLATYKLVSLRSADLSLVLFVETFALWLLGCLVVAVAFNFWNVLAEPHAGALAAAYSVVRFSVAYLALTVISTVAFVSGGSAHGILQGSDN
jgi:hypothetical protein